MKLQVTQENLTKALQTVGRVASTRGTLPILANVVIKTIGTRVAIAATNLDIAMTQYIGSKVSQEGSITVPARLMQDFIATLPPGIINLELEEYKLHITTDQYNSVINGISAEEFPVMPALTDGSTWTVSSRVLKQALQQVLPAAGNDDARPVLTGVYLHTQDKKLYMVATDSYRLAEKSLIRAKEDIKLLVPATAMQDLLRILGDNDEEVEVTYNEQQILFKVDEIELMSRLIDGTYPDYQKLIPKSFAISATLKKADFINVTRVSSLFARESAGSITLQVEDGKINIRSVASQLGENTATAPAKTSGEGDITLNSKYLLDALSAVGGTETTISFNGKLNACVVRAANDSSYTHVIMPLKS